MRPMETENWHELFRGKIHRKLRTGADLGRVTRYSGTKAT